MKLPILLRIYFNEKLEGVRQFDVKQVVIGRNSDAQLQLSDEAVAPLHAFIEERESGYYVADLGSTSGVYRNGQKVLDEKLESGDEIKIGPYKIQFFIGVPKPAGPPKKDAPKVVEPPQGKPEKKVEAEKPKKPVAIPPSPPPEEVFSAPKVKVAAAKAKHSGTKTFAPPSLVNDARDIVKPSKGTVIEVLVAWKERIIAARHFNERGEVTVGADPTCDIVVPLFGGGTKYPIVRISNLASVCLTQDMSGELIREQGAVSFVDLFKQNKMRPNEGLYELDIPQGEMARINFQGGLLSVFVRYVPETPKPLVAPLFDFTASEVTGVILAFVVSAIFGLYMMVYAPQDLLDEAKIEEPLRKATVTFKAPIKKEIVQVQEKPVEEKKVVQIVEKQQKTQTPTTPQKGTPGKAGEVAPKPPSKEPPKVTSAKSGGAIKTAPKEGASAKSQKPDPTKVGLLGVFGSKGTQSKLDKTFSGAGDLTGLAENATGFAGNAESRAGDSMGTKLKDTGPGGKGSATVGITGVGTKGKGTDSYGLGTGGIGTKGNVDIDVGGQEAEFVGSIDKEAIRRIIQANKNSIRACYERSLQRKPDLYGKLVLEWDIEEQGRVTRTSVKSNTLGDSQVANCIMGRIKELKFPEPPPDTVGRVTFPFVFSSQ